MDRYTAGQTRALNTLGLTKTALSLGTLRNYMAQRAGQSLGGANALTKSLGDVTATTSRQAVQSLDGLGKYRLNSVMENSRALRQSQNLPSRVGLGDTAITTRNRVGQAIRDEAALGGSREGGVPLSHAYEGYMSPEGRSYGGAHVEQVMGLPAGSYTPKPGPTALMKPPQPAGEATPALASHVRTKVPVDAYAATQVTQPNTVITPIRKRMLQR